jgi:hypothetical protein
MSVSTSDIATDLGIASPTTLQNAQWEMWISDAKMLIEARRVELAADELDRKKVDYVVRKAVVAHAGNPENATTVTIAVDDGSTSRRYESGQGRVSVDGWWGFLGLDEGTDGAFTINPTGWTDTSGVTTW